MSMRIKITLIIMSIVLIATADSFITNLFFVKRSITNSYQNSNIYILDENGAIIGHNTDEFVLPGDILKQVLSAGEGSGYFIYDKMKYICKYKPITVTTSDWYVLVATPEKESTESKVKMDLFFSSMIFLGIGLLASIFAPPLLVKPFKKIEDQNNMLKTLNKAAQEQSAEILEAHKRTNLLLNAMPVSCHLWNSNLEMFYCNEESMRLFHPQSLNLFVKTFAEFSPEYQPDGQLSSKKRDMYLKKAFDEGKCVFEWMHQLKDGTLIPAEVTLVRVTFEDEDVVAAYVRDLREHKNMTREIEQRDKLLDTINVELQEALIEAQKASNAKSNFLTNMSHEMRTPLNVIIGLSQLSMDIGETNEEILSNLEKIYEAGETLLSTVNDILDISKIEAGKLELVHNEYEIPSLINDTVTQNILLIGEKPIKFILDIDADIPTYLYGDELRIKQIFNNLLTNAFKYTNKGKVELKVKCERQGEAVWMTIQVKDSGIGIRSEDIGNLFTDYNQMDIKANHKIEGTGLGLSITKKLTEMMEGFVTVESEYGKGSVFTAKIKQKLVNDSTIGEEVVHSLKNFRYSNQKRRKNSLLARKQMHDAKVLVVDDMITNLDVTKGMLYPYGMQVDCITNGQEAINLIRSEKTIYDVIFMDHMMPEMDGIETVRIIRNEIGTQYAKTVPIIALTANAIIGNEEMFLGNGFQAFISKPINVKQLDAVLNKWLVHKQSEKTLLKPKKAKEESTEPNEKSAKSTQKNNFNTLKYAFVKGVDINEGLERYNDETIYLDILRSYCLHTPAILEKIRTLSIDESTLTEASEKIEGISLAEYTISVHGLKGASYNICADTVGAAAGKLEIAAREGDFPLLMALNDSFITMVETLIDDLNKLLEKVAAGKEKKQTAHAPDSELLSKLLKASKLYKTSAMEQIMRELEAYEYKTGGKLVSWLRDKMDTLSYDAIQDRLNNEIKNKEIKNVRS